MSPHVLVRAEKHEEPDKLGSLTASLFFCFFCISVFALASLLATYLERYKQGIVRFLLSPFDGTDEEDELDQLHQNLLLNHQNLHQFDQLNRSYQYPFHHYGYNHAFTMNGSSKFTMDSNERVLFHVQTTMGCNGLRDLYNLGFMRQDTLEKRVDGAIGKLSVSSIVSVCAVWLREKICRNSSLGMSPNVKELCVFLHRRACSRDMCCQIFYAAFQRCPSSQVNQISLRVYNKTLTDFRDVVDFVYDNWYRWVEAAIDTADAAEAAAAATTTTANVAFLAANGPLPLSYPAYNHNLDSMSEAKQQQHVQESLKKLHRHQNHHYYHDKIKVVGGTPPLHEGHQPGDCAPYDLGQASTWGSEAGQAERCNTRRDDCVCRQCNIRGWLSLLPATPNGAPLFETSFTLPPTASSPEHVGLTADATGHDEKDSSTIHKKPIPEPEYVCPNCGQQGVHYNNYCNVNQWTPKLVYGQDKEQPAAQAKMQMDPQRAALMSTSNNKVAQPPQVPLIQLEADSESSSSSDLIMFSSSSEAEQVQIARSNDAGGNSPVSGGLRYTDGRLSP
ncbi:hypothetical protein ACHAQJ_002114 [Trichoderma viride]